ncbi:hypothetical protein BpHYR1_042094, partial [Brachionus plicatilis]
MIAIIKSSYISIYSWINCSNLDLPIQFFPSYDVILNILSCVAYYAKSYLSDVHNSACRCFLQKLAYYADVN